MSGETGGVTEKTHERPWLGNALLALAFVALVVVGVVTVIMPELEDDPEAETTATPGSTRSEGDAVVPTDVVQTPTP